MLPGWSFPKVLYKSVSPISGKITVVRRGGERQLIVGGMVQSINGDAPGAGERVWGKIVDQIATYHLPLASCLILGLGGGTVAHLLVKKYPKVKIVGVEIDPEIIKVGREFFDLGKLKNLRIICADAFGVVERPGTSPLGREKFDLIVVDIYLGRLFPLEFESFGFLTGVKNLLKTGGLLVINRIFPYKEKVEKKFFAERLEKFFTGIIIQEVKGMAKERNFIFSGRLG